MFLGLRLHYSLLAFLYKFDAYTSAFWSSGDTAPSRTRSPSLPFPSLCCALEDHGISRNAIALTFDVSLAPHTNQRPGLFIRPFARHHRCSCKWSIERLEPQSHRQRIRDWGGSHPYLKATASRKAPLWREKPNSASGSAVSQLEAPFSQAQTRTERGRPGTDPYR